MKNYLAFDLGASSGRAIVGIIDKGILKIDEIHRFPNEQVRVFDSIYWDLLDLFKKIKNSILKYKAKYGHKLESIGIDTWGVDFVLLNEKDEIAGQSHTLRDPRTNNILESMLNQIPKSYIFKKIGIQFMDINTSCQIFSMVQKNCPELRIANTFLMIPDYFNFLLSGVKCTEISIASTTQLFNPIKNSWENEFIEKLGLKKKWFCEIKEPATILGSIRKQLADELEISPNIKIIAPLCHDTASAVAAVPVDLKIQKQGEWAYISSGTWSLIGIELDKTLINEKVMQYNFTNERGFNKKIRFLKNLSGMWIIQECKKIWDKEFVDLSWDDIENRAKMVPQFKNFIDPDHSSFFNPGNMIEEIKSFCETHQQKPPISVGEIARTIFESMAFNYKKAITNLEGIIGKKIKLLHIIGGGSKNDLLNQFTANALNIPVIAGPAEAAGIGNILVQALSLGEIENVIELRKIVRKSFALKRFLPENSKKWDNFFKIFLEKIG
ncbi:MAG: rhamnulokinase [Candidatus Lokiarchaeota archaeon]|nr:rhamnulokinase [Candidatus Lokiarchaeota archaeon]